MSKFFGKLGRLVSWARSKPVGYDLEGNRYFEVPSLNGGRTKRTVDYKIKRDLADYTDGQRLPVQWLSWLSHTRSQPPTIEELQADLQRRYILAQNVAQIQAREAAEEQARLLTGPTETASLEPRTAERRQAAAAVEEPTKRETKAEARLEHLSPRSPPSPFKGSADPSSSWTSHDHAPPSSATKPPTFHTDPNSPTSPTLRELSQLRMAKERAELERAGVDLAKSAGHDQHEPGSTMTGAGAVPVGSFAPVARRRGAGSLEGKRATDAAPMSQGGTEPPGSVASSPSEFARAWKHMHESPLEGVTLTPADPKSAAHAGKPVTSSVEHNQKDAGTNSQGQLDKVEGRADTWAATRARRQGGE